MKPSDHTIPVLLRKALEELRLAQRSAREAVQAVQTALEALTTTQQLAPGPNRGDTAAHAAKEK